MKHAIIAVLVSQMLCLTTLAYATPKMVVIEKGQPAPFSGTLLNPEAQAKILAEKEKVKEECELDKNYLRMRENEKCKHALALKKIEQEALQAKMDAILKIKNSEIESLQDLALKSNRSKIWYLVGGIVVGLGVMIGGAYIVRGINQ